MDPPKLTFPVVLFSQSVPIPVVIAPLTVAVPPFANVILAFVPEAGPVTLVTLIFPETEYKVKVCAAAIVIGPAFKLAPKLIVWLFATLVVRDNPKSIAPVLRICKPPIKLVPDPVRVMKAKALFIPMASVVIVPLPASIVNPKALSTVPKVTLPFAELVVMVRSAEKPVDREVPFRSTLPATVRLPLSVLAPVPARLNPVRGVVDPTTANVTPPLPLLVLKE
jgi:hypothetical protein